MKSIYISLLVIVSSSYFLEAQLLTPYTLYRDQWGVINPASISNNYTLDEFTFSLSATNRHQWLGHGCKYD